MTRGWAAATAVGMAASCIPLALVAPLAVFGLGYQLSPTDALVLAVGAAAYVVFIGMVVATLNREGRSIQRTAQALREALEAAGGQRRQVAVPGQYEPRDPHAPQRRAGHGAT